MPKYFAIRIANMVVLRRTIIGLMKHDSTLLTKTGKQLMRQISYTGGKVLGTIPYTTWVERVGSKIVLNGYVKTNRLTVNSLNPFITKGKDIV